MLRHPHPHTTKNKQRHQHTSIHRLVLPFRTEKLGAPHPPRPRPAPSAQVAAPPTAGRARPAASAPVRSRSSAPSAWRANGESGAGPGARWFGPPVESVNLGNSTSNSRPCPAKARGAEVHAFSNSWDIQQRLKNPSSTMFDYPIGNAGYGCYLRSLNLCRIQDPSPNLTSIAFDRPLRRWRRAAFSDLSLKAATQKSRRDEVIQLIFAADDDRHLEA